MSTYNLTDPNSPVVSGRLLALLCNIFETLGEVTGITGYFCNDAGLHCLRATDYTETPTAMPVWAPNQEMVNAAVPNGINTFNARDYLFHIQKEAEIEATQGPKPLSGEHRFLRCRDFYVAYMSGRTTPVEVAERLFELIQASEDVSPSLGAVWKWNKEAILKQAKESAARYCEGRPLSIVDGVPIVIKDAIDVEGFETGVGTNFINKGNPATEDAHLVALLRAHGAVIVGKSTMHEIGIGVTNFNPSTRTPRNPYQPLHSTGGSSGGSGAAVGSGLCPISIGTDGGGSIRIPGSYCGIYGLKPTHGRISARGEYPLAPTVGICGPMCATVEDLAIVYAIIAGQDEKDFYSRIQPSVALPAPFQHPNASRGGQLQGLRIGIYRKWFEDVSNPEISKVCYKMLERLCKDHGAVLVEIEIPELFEIGKAHNIVIVGEMLPKLYNDRKKLNYHSRVELALMASLRLQDFARAQQQKTRSIRYLETLFGLKDTDAHHQSLYPRLGGQEGPIDVIVTPTVANLPPKVTSGAESHGETNYLNNVKTMQYMMLANFTGIPAITAVAGYTRENYVHQNGDRYPKGFPVGIQFMGQWWDEKRLIHIAGVCEQVLGTRQKPKIWVGDYNF
ncbi:amidase signature domain-containing protein [Mortierella sp. GBAus27b]|nr:amidase signature domain-containing protein [Mortierella sp. GBAus27b]